MFAYTYVCAPCAHLAPTKAIGSPGTGVTESCEIPCRCQNSNVGSVKEQPVFLTIVQSLQPLLLPLLRHDLLTHHVVLTD